MQWIRVKEMMNPVTTCSRLESMPLSVGIENMGLGLPLVIKGAGPEGNLDGQFTVDKVRTLKLLLQDVQTWIRKRVEILEFTATECSSKEFKSLLIAE